MAPQTVLITGCSDNGIGSGLGKVFHERDYHVFATARNPAKMTWLEGLSNVTPITLDITKSDDIQAALEVVTKATGGQLDHLINNAARNHFMPVLDEDLDEARKLYEAKGMVTFITSIAGYLNTPWMGTYAATKRSIELVAETLRLELQPLGVNVLCVVTGSVKTAGQTYFEDLKLPKTSLYKDIEDNFIIRAHGKIYMPRMDAVDYANGVVEQIAARASGKFWYGESAEMARQGTTNITVPQAAMDAPGFSWSGLGDMKK